MKSGDSLQWLKIGTGLHPGYGSGVG